jgi:tetratricopeptide (TPR) repeat protein
MGKMTWAALTGALMKKGMRAALAAALLAAVCMGGAGAAWTASLEDELFLAADAYYRGLDARSERAFGDVLKREPDNDYALSRLGVLLAEKGDLEGAAASLEKALAAAPDNLFALKWLGIVALRRGDMDQAARRFQAMLDIDPGNGQATAWQAILLLLAGDRNAAVQRLALASAQDHEDPGLHYLLAQAFLALDMPENARLELETTLELRPTDVPALTRLGVLFYRTGQRDLAEASWRQALAVAPEAAEARFCLSRSLADAALAAQAAGNPAKADRLWRLALEADPGNGEAAAALYAGEAPQPPGAKPGETAGEAPPKAAK